MASIALGQVIGEGAHGIVREATYDGRSVVAKVSKGRDHDERIEAEYELLRRLHEQPRPGGAGWAIVQPIVAITCGERPGLLLERVAGQSLLTWLGSRVFSDVEAMAIGRTLAGAIAHVHRAGATHGDIHPRNVVVEFQGEKLALSLLDFSAAVQRATDLDRRKDIKDIARLVRAVLREPEPGDCRVKLADVLSKAEHLNMAQGFATAEELARAFAEASDDEPVNPPTDIRPKRKFRLVGAAALALAVIGASPYAYVFRPTSDPAAECRQADVAEVLPWTGDLPRAKRQSADDGLFLAVISADTLLRHGPASEALTQAVVSASQEYSQRAPYRPAERLAVVGRIEDQARVLALDLLLAGEPCVESARHCQRVAGEVHDVDLRRTLLQRADDLLFGLGEFALIALERRPAAQDLLQAVLTACQEYVVAAPMKQPDRVRRAESIADRARLLALEAAINGPPSSAHARRCRQVAGELNEDALRDGLLERADAMLFGLIVGASADHERCPQSDALLRAVVSSSDEYLTTSPGTEPMRTREARRLADHARILALEVELEGPASTVNARRCLRVASEVTDTSIRKSLLQRADDMLFALVSSSLAEFERCTGSVELMRAVVAASDEYVTTAPGKPADRVLAVQRSADRARLLALEVELDGPPSAMRARRCQQVAGEVLDASLRQVLLRRAEELDHAWQQTEVVAFEDRVTALLAGTGEVYAVGAALDAFAWKSFLPDLQDRAGRFVIRVEGELWARIAGKLRAMDGPLAREEALVGFLRLRPSSPFRMQAASALVEVSAAADDLDFAGVPEPVSGFGDGAVQVRARLDAVARYLARRPHGRHRIAALARQNALAHVCALLDLSMTRGDPATVSHAVDALVPIIGDQADLVDLVRCLQSRWGLARARVVVQSAVPREDFEDAIGKADLYVRFVVDGAAIDCALGGTVYLSIRPDTELAVQLIDDDLALDDVIDGGSISLDEVRAGVVRVGRSVIRLELQVLEPIG